MSNSDLNTLHPNTSELMTLVIMDFLEGKMLIESGLDTKQQWLQVIFYILYWV